MTDAPDRSSLAPPAPRRMPTNGAHGTSSHGEGRDRQIERTTFTPKRLVLGLAALLMAGLVGYLLWEAQAGGQRLTVEREKLQVATVQRAPFQEYIAVTGTAIPRRTVYLEAVEGGRVEEVFARSGEMVEAGDPLLRLSNNDLRLRLMENESRLAEQASNVQTQRFQMEQQRLSLQQQLAQMDYEIRRLERQHRRNEQLHDKGYISDQDYEEVLGELEYQRRRRDLTQRAFQQDSLAQASRLREQEGSLQRQRTAFAAMQQDLQNLTVRAPVAGRLTALDAEVGQIRSAGARFGQIDDTTGYNIRARVDEFYIERVQQGQEATTQSLGGETYELRVSRVYPEVESGTFRVDLVFTGEAPEGLRRGQTVRLRLELGQPEEALLVERGGFYQSTGGQWAYVLTEGGEAVRRPIELGRQNPQHFEVLGGLEAGEQVVTSSYETFGDADRLVLE